MATVPSPAGPQFGSPAWTDLYLHALREADRLGLEITLNVLSGWNMGGPGVTPEQASKVLTWSRTPVAGGSQVAVRLPEPPSKNGFYRQIAVLAYALPHGAKEPPATGPALRFRSAAAETGFSMPDSDWMLSPQGTPGGGSGLSRAAVNDRRAAAADVAEHGNPTTSSSPSDADIALADVRDLTQQTASDGSLSWNAPPGDWEILRIGYTDAGTLTCALPCAKVSTSSGAWQGLALDYLSREAFDRFWQATIEPLLLAAKPYHSLKYLAEDSWELGGTNWTEDFRKEFRSRRGYDPVPWLPAVAGRVVGSPDASTRFLTDLRRTVADLVSTNHYDRFAERAAAFGLGVQSESGGPHGAPIDALETFRHSAVPQTEFWSQNPHRSRDLERYFTKEAASAASIYGQRFVAQEGETSIQRQWNESLATDLKPSFDMAVTEGMNRLVWHQFTSSPASTGLPGQEYFAGTHLNPKVTWWNAGTAFFQYLDRVQYMMQQGTPVHDVLYFYGDNIPAFVRFKADDPAHVLPGYDFDVTNQDALLHTIHGEGGDLVGPSGVHWKVLAMPHSGRLSLVSLEKIAAFVQGGATVVGHPPASSTGMADAAQRSRFQAVVAQLWGNTCDSANPHRAGAGQVFCTEDTRSVLAAMGIRPDLSTDAVRAADPARSTSPVDYVHRRVGSTDIYFLRNGSATGSVLNPVFRVQGKVPALWDPVSGQLDSRQTLNGQLPYDTLPDGRTEVHLTLPAFGSAFVVFTDGPAHAQAAAPEALQQAEFTPLRPWTVTFQSGRGAPSGPVAFPELKSWTDSSVPGLRFFSGTATYRAQVNAPASAGGEVWLRLTDVREIARVRINGHDAGTIWAKPLTLRVDRWLKPGVNDVEMEITNLWPNRIIGDLQPGQAEHITRTNITFYHTDSPLLPSGLIGPVFWETRQ